jgi:hypothetical protein
MHVGQGRAVEPCDLGEHANPAVEDVVDARLWVPELGTLPLSWGFAGPTGLA